MKEGLCFEKADLLELMKTLNEEGFRGERKNRNVEIIGAL